MRIDRRLVFLGVMLCILAFAFGANAAVVVGNGVAGDPSSVITGAPLPDWWNLSFDPYDMSQKLQLNFSLENRTSAPSGQDPAANGWAWDGWDVNEGWDWNSSYTQTSLTLDNRAHPDRIKDLWVWWTYHSNEAGEAVVTAPDGTPAFLEGEGHIDLGGGTYGAWSHWQIKPQPSEETITWLGCNHPTGQVWVGTYCAPGLPAFALVGVAPVVGAILRRRARR
jgi:hypothetical protein